MADIHKMLEKAHLLRQGGAPFKPDKTWVHDDPKATGGPGHALCSCGELSPILPSAAARKRWHKEHRAEMDGHVHREPFFDPEGDGPGAATPEPEQASQESPADEEDLIGSAAPEPEDDLIGRLSSQTPRVVVYSGAARCFWNVLAVDSAERIARELGAMSEPRRSDHTLAILGDNADDVAAYLPTFWSKANKDFHLWKRTDEGYRGLRMVGNAKKVREAEIAWFRDYTDGVLDLLRGLQPRSEDAGYLAGMSSGLTFPAGSDLI